jgi:hypothetical protein
MLWVAHFFMAFFMASFDVRLVVALFDQLVSGATLVSCVGAWVRVLATGVVLS